MRLHVNTDKGWNYMQVGKKNEITCECGCRLRLHVIACRSVFAYERNGCNVPWHVITNME